MDWTVRKIILIVTIMVPCFLVTLLRAQNDEEQFLRAHQEYMNGRYEQALALYQSIENKGSATWYNVGNCHYHMNNYPQALACWYRAQCGASSKECDAIMHNINEVHNRTDSSELKTMHIIHWFAKPFSHFSLFILQLLFLGSWYCMFFLYKRRRRSIGFISVVTMNAVLSILFFIGIGI
ncbi:MAG: hypothetical protein Q8Q25_00130, partial [bacterium]|nr:hypothetical protein [bacterium]